MLGIHCIAFIYNYKCFVQFTAGTVRCYRQRIVFGPYKSTR